MDWNALRYAADALYMSSAIFLLWRMLSKGSCGGVSLKSQCLYLIVFVSRFFNGSIFSPPNYNIITRLFYLGSTSASIYLIVGPMRKTYERRYDSFRIVFILLICVPISWISARRMTVSQFFWCYSLWTEAFALLPQMIMFARSKSAGVITPTYIFMLSFYKIVYLMSLVYSSLMENRRTALVVWTSGGLQAILYSDFIYFYMKSKATGKDFALPHI